MAKENAPELLLRAAAKGKLAGKRIYLSPNTDPYVPEERQWRITRHLLEFFRKYPPALLVIQTRSPSILDDLDLLTQMRPFVVVGVSISTDREEVRKVLEPRCPPIAARLAALQALHSAGITTQASLAPLLPCDARVLAEAVTGHCDWVVAQPLKGGGRGARTWVPALRLVEQHGWQGWLDGGAEVRQTLGTLRALLGERFWEGQEGFALPWLSGNSVRTRGI